MDIKMMVEVALAQGAIARMHPNRFVQLDLTPNQRLHVWAPDLPVAQLVRTPIHDHTFDFQSEILLGRLAHREWDSIHYCDGPYKIYKASTGIEAPELVFNGYTCDLGEERNFLFGAGSRYFFRQGQFHDSWAEELTLTVISKRSSSTGNPRVLVPRTLKGPDNDFRRHQYSHELLMTWVQRALAKL